MDLKKAKRIVTRINKRENEDVARLYEGYSGRGMFGNRTAGVVLPGWAIPKNWKGSVDNMGRNMIIY